MLLFNISLRWNMKISEQKQKKGVETYETPFIISLRLDILVFYEDITNPYLTISTSCVIE